MTWYLRIPKERFIQLYGDKVDVSIFERTPEDNADLISNFLPSKLWRLNNLYYIVDKDGGDEILFRMNEAQHVVYAASLDHPRLIILKSRQQGISTFWLINFFDDAITRKNHKIGLMAQGKDEAGTLLERVEMAINHLNPNIAEFFGFKLVEKEGKLVTKLDKNNAAELGFSNGSTIFIRVSFRSSTLQRLHISEYGKICAEKPKRAIETKTGSLQTIKVGNFVIIESTADGNNDFKEMWDQAEERKALIESCVISGYSGKDYKPVFLSWLYDNDCNSDIFEIATPKQIKYFTDLEKLLDITIRQTQRNFWISQYRELGEKIFQEYPATAEEAFQKINKGTYYAHQYKEYVVKQNREIRGLYDPALEVNVAMDLGVDEDDFFTLLYFQRYEKEWRMIMEYTNNGMGLGHYVNHMHDMEDRYKYKINKVICPHDVAVRELGTTEVATSREESLRKLGVKNIVVVEKTGNLAADIETVRQYIKYMYVDPNTCPYIIKCIKNYAREWDDKANTWSRKPNHNEWSHGADAVRAMIKSKVGQVNRDMVKRRESVISGIAM